MGITRELRDKIRAMHAAGYSCVEIAKTMNIPETAIRYIVRTNN